jgi:hypothetical protein
MADDKKDINYKNEKRNIRDTKDKSDSKDKISCQ